MIEITESYKVNRELLTIDEHMINDENVFNTFFDGNKETIYILNGQGRTIGMITLGSFLKALENGDENYTKKIKFYVEANGDEKKEYDKAVKKIVDNGINTGVPIIDNNGKILYEVVKCHELQDVRVLEQRLGLYKKSVHLSNEFNYINSLLLDESIVFISSNNTGEYLREILGVDFREKVRNIDNPYRMILSSSNLVIDISIPENITRRMMFTSCSNGFAYDTFLEELIWMVETECASRVDYLLNYDSNIIKEFYSLYLTENACFWLNKIYRNALINLFINLSIDFTLPHSIYERKYAMTMIKENGHIRPSSMDGAWFQSIDRILQFERMSKYCITNNIQILNLSTEGDALLNDVEIESFSKCRYFREMYDDDFDTLQTMYVGESEAKKRKIEEISQFGLIIKRRVENDLSVNADVEGSYFNIENGIRYTCYSPAEYNATIYFFGACTIFGTVVSDEFTIPSLIQKKINSQGLKYRVINLGMSGTRNILKMIKALNLGKNDIIVTLYTQMVPTVSSEINCINIIPQINLRKAQNNINMYFEHIGHVGELGSEIYAEVIADYLMPRLKNEINHIEKNNVYKIFRRDDTDLRILYDFDKFEKIILREKRYISNNNKRISTIVMNANPFTLGHKFLVERAAKESDWLYVFVVEEDGSFFNTEDRFNMVRMGTEEFPNVSVLKSGRMLISMVTLPEYFNREKTRDNNSEIYLNRKLPAVDDVRIFAEYIAPLAGINVRYVGDEPIDGFTAHYNSTMKRILPLYGIEYVEISRRRTNSRVISASEVRRQYLNGDFNSMEEFVPQTTLDYLYRLRRNA